MTYMRHQPSSHRQTALGAGLVLLLAVGAAAVAGYVFDGAGRPALGFWAMTWGIGVGLLGMTVVAAVSRWRAARLLAGLLAVGAAISGGMLLVFSGPFQLSPASPEGLWLYPSVLVLFAVGGVASRRAAMGSPDLS